MQKIGGLACEYVSRAKLCLYFEVWEGLFVWRQVILCITVSVLFPSAVVSLVPKSVLSGLSRWLFNVADCCNINPFFLPLVLHESLESVVAQHVQHESNDVSASLVRYVLAFVSRQLGGKKFL